MAATLPLLLPLLLADAVGAMSGGVPAFLAPPACLFRGQALSPMRARAERDELNESLGDFPAYNNVSALPGGASPLAVPLHSLAIARSACTAAPGWRLGERVKGREFSEDLAATRTGRRRGSWRGDASAPKIEQGQL